MVAARPINELLETSDLQEWATLWLASNAVADAFGNKRVSKAVQIPSGWRLTSNLSADPHSGAETIVGKVNVDRPITRGSIIFRGAKDDYKSGDQLYQVIGYTESMDVNDECERRAVFIALWNTALPEAV